VRPEGLGTLTKKRIGPRTRDLPASATACPPVKSKIKVTVNFYISLDGEKSDRILFVHLKEHDPDVFPVR
jgi:hypothetical protein